MRAEKTVPLTEEIVRSELSGASLSSARRVRSDEISSSKMMAESVTVDGWLSSMGVIETEIEAGLDSLPA